MGGQAVMPPVDRQLIIVADTGPLIRLAAAGLLDTLRGLNRRIVLVDRVEDEVIGDRSKPFAREIAAWIASMGDAILRVETVTGVGIETLRRETRTAERDQLLKSALRDSASSRCENSWAIGGRPKRAPPSSFTRIEKLRLCL
jgi:hypothetical protein